MELSKVNYVFFLGIGGIGMSALARYFKSAGKTVSGYDKTETPLTIALEAEGIEVSFEDDVMKLPKFVTDSTLNEQTLIIYTPAIPKDHLQYNFILNSGLQIVKRAVVLGWLTKDSFTIAIAGTHGKTTTATIITHILKSAGVNCAAFLGGVSTNYQSNFIAGKYDSNNKPIVIVEADEFDRSFLTLHPDIAVITSMDADHLDIYGEKEELEDSYRLFAKQVKPNGKLIAKSGLPLNTNFPPVSYSINSKADYCTTNITVEHHAYHFDIATPEGNYSNWALGMPGRHNIENALAAIAVAFQLNISAEKVQHALNTFLGVKRRFEYHLKGEDCTYIDDYAHHPEELRAAISSVKELYSDKKVTGVFQPHLFSRTRDFADGFATSLSLLDTVIMLDIYPARELPIDGVTSKLILDKVTVDDKQLCSKTELLSVIKKRKPEVLLTLGAGDIDQLVQPVKSVLA